MGARVWGTTPHAGTKGRAHKGRADAFPRPRAFRRGLPAAHWRQGAFLGTLAQKRATRAEPRRAPGKQNSAKGACGRALVKAEPAQAPDTGVDVPTLCR